MALLSGRCITVIDEIFVRFQVCYVWPQGGPDDERGAAGSWRRHAATFSLDLSNWRIRQHKGKAQTWQMLVHRPFAFLVCRTMRILQPIFNQWWTSWIVNKRSAVSWDSHVHQSFAQFSAPLKQPSAAKMMNKEDKSGGLTDPTTTSQRHEFYKQPLRQLITTEVTNIL